MPEVHLVVGVCLIAANLAAGVWGGYLWLERRPSTGFWYALRIAQAGFVWVSWPKKTSGVATELTENVVRDFGLAQGLVDVKVCAVDDTWSGLKFVRRLKDR